MEGQLDDEAARYMSEINHLTQSLAKPWTDAPGISGKVEMVAAGHSFPSEYAGFEEAL
jgi:tagatose 1,6-diphosphate aldolase